MISIFRQKQVMDVANEYILKRHIYPLSFEDCVKNYPDHEIILFHPMYDRSDFLILASKYGYDDFVRRLLPKCKRGLLYAALRHAASNGHLTTVKLLLNAKKNLTYLRSNFRVVRIACRYGHLNLVKYFISISSGLRRELKSNLIQTITNVACENGQSEIVRYMLLEHKVELTDNQLVGLYRGNCIDLIPLLPRITTSLIEFAIGNCSTELNETLFKAYPEYTRFIIHGNLSWYHNAILMKKLKFIIDVFDEMGCCHKKLLELIKSYEMNRQLPCDMYKYILSKKSVVVDKTHSHFERILLTNNLKLLETLVEGRPRFRKDILSIQHYFRTEDDSRMDDSYRATINGTKIISFVTPRYVMSPDVLGYVLSMK